MRGSQARAATARSLAPRARAPLLTDLEPEYAPRLRTAPCTSRHMCHLASTDTNLMREKCGRVRVAACVLQAIPDVRVPSQSITIHHNSSQTITIHHNPSQSFAILRRGRLAGIRSCIRLGIRMGITVITGLASDLNSHKHKCSNRNRIGAYRDVPVAPSKTRLKQTLSMRIARALSKKRTSCQGRPMKAHALPCLKPLMICTLPLPHYFAPLRLAACTPMTSHCCCLAAADHAAAASTRRLAATSPPSLPKPPLLVPPTPNPTPSSQAT